MNDAKQNVVIGEVENQIDITGKKIESLEEITTRLRQRFSIVLCNTPKCESEGRDRVASKCELGSRLSSNNDRLDVLISRLNEIIDDCNL